MKKKNRSDNLINAGISLAVVGGLTGNKGVSRVGGLLFGVGIVDKVLSKNKSLRR